MYEKQRHFHVVTISGHGFKALEWKNDKITIYPKGIFSYIQAFDQLRFTKMQLIYLSINTTWRHTQFSTMYNYMYNIQTNKNMEHTNIRIKYLMIQIVNKNCFDQNIWRGYLPIAGLNRQPVLSTAPDTWKALSLKIHWKIVCRQASAFFLLFRLVI